MPLPTDHADSGLCDACREHRAVHHYLDPDHAFGIRRRHLCVTCLARTPEQRLAQTRVAVAIAQSGMGLI